MSRVFDKLLTVEFAHDYGELKDGFFNVRPSPLTIKTLKRHRVQFRQQVDTLTLLYEADDADDSGVPLVALSDATFSFYLELRDQRFTNVTDLPLVLNKKVAYFTNLNAQKKDTDLLLSSSSPSSAYVSEGDLFVASAQQLNVNEESVHSVEYRLVSEDGMVHYQKTHDPVEGVIRFSHDFSHLSPGLFEIKKNNVTDKTIYADNTLTRQPVFGVVNVQLSDLVPADYQLIDGDGNVTHKTYKLTFPTRMSTWRYYVIPRDTVLEEGESLVVTGNEGITFGSAVLTPLVNRDTAHVFSSDAEVAMQKNSRKSIVLEKKKDGMGKTLLEHMPNPDPLSLSLEADQVYSDIYIYI